MGMPKWQTATPEANIRRDERVGPRSCGRPRRKVPGVCALHRQPDVCTVSRPYPATARRKKQSRRWLCHHDSSLAPAWRKAMHSQSGTARNLEQSADQLGLGDGCLHRSIPTPKMRPANENGPTMPARTGLPVSASASSRAAFRCTAVRQSPGCGMGSASISVREVTCRPRIVGISSSLSRTEQPKDSALGAK